jgi:hypothetical protein
MDFKIKEKTMVKNSTVSLIMALCLASMPLHAAQEYATHDPVQKKPLKLFFKNLQKKALFAKDKCSEKIRQFKEKAKKYTTKKNVRIAAGIIGACTIFALHQFSKDRPVIIGEGANGIVCENAKIAYQQGATCGYHSIKNTAALITRERSSGTNDQTAQLFNTSANDQKDPMRTHIHQTEVENLDRTARARQREQLAELHRDTFPNLGELEQADRIALLEDQENRAAVEQFCQNNARRNYLANPITREDILQEQRANPNPNGFQFIPYREWLNSQQIQDLATRFYPHANIGVIPMDEQIDNPEFVFENPDNAVYQRLQQPGVHGVVVPTDAENHWIGLVINRQPGQPVRYHVADSMGAVDFWRSQRCEDLIRRIETPATVNAYLAEKNKLSQQLRAALQPFFRW